MAKVIPFGPRAPTTSREAYLESVLALGRGRGVTMTAREALDIARLAAWHQIWRITLATADEGWCPAERDWFPLIETITDPAVRAELTDLASMAVG